MVGSSGRRIVVEFIGDSSSLKKGLNEGETALQGFSGKAQAAGRIAGKVLAGGLILAGAAAIKATQAAAEDEAAQSQLAQQLKQAAGASDSQIASTESWITAQGKATGITDDELRPALARLATATGDVGEAQKLAALAMDVSAGSGKSYQQVTEALAKAQNGNIGALGRLGIATKDASGETKSLTEIQQDLADKYNGAASKAAETAAGKQKILTTQFGELQEQIGAKLLPVMVQLGEAGLKIVTWISENTKLVGIFVASLASLLAITTAVGAATKAWTAITTVWSAVTKAAAAVQWLLNAALSANPIGLVVIAIAALVAGLIIAYKNSETFRKIVDAAFNGIKDVVTTVVDFVVGFVKNHWQLLIAIIGGPLGIIVGLVIKHFDSIKNGISTAINTVKTILGGAWDAIVNAVRTVLGVYRTVITTAFGAIRDYFGNAVAGWKTLFNNAWDAIKDGFRAAKEALSTIAGNIKDAVTNAFDAMKAPIQAVIDKVQWLIDKIGDLISKIKSMPHIPNPLGKVAAGAGRAGAGGGTKDAIAAAAGVADAAGGVARASATDSGGGNTYVTIKVESWDPALAGKAVVEALRKFERATGRKLLASPA